MSHGCKRKAEFSPYEEENYFSESSQCQHNDTEDMDSGGDSDCDVDVASDSDVDDDDDEYKNAIYAEAARIVSTYQHPEDIGQDERNEILEEAARIAYEIGDIKGNLHKTQRKSSFSPPLPTIPEEDIEAFEGMRKFASYVNSLANLNQDEKNEIIENAMNLL
jgi:hypothetical protein